MSDQSSTASGGVSITGILGIVFIVLKLTGTITWPWVWVLSPLWIPIALTLVIMATVGIFFIIALALK